MRKGPAGLYPCSIRGWILVPFAGRVQKMYVDYARNFYSSHSSYSWFLSDFGCGRWLAWILSLSLLSFCATTAVFADGDFVRDLQTRAIERGQSPLGHWGPQSDNYVGWKNHTLRLIPVYTFGTGGAGTGIDLSSYTGANSAYR